MSRPRWARLEEVTPSTMFCCICKFRTNGPYESEELDGESVGVCPRCGNYNTGGYSSFAPILVWPADMLPTTLRRLALT